VIPDVDKDDGSYISDAKVRDMRRRSNRNDVLATIKKHIVVLEERSRTDPAARETLLEIATPGHISRRAQNDVTKRLVLWMWKDRGFDAHKIEDYLSRITYSVLGLKVGALQPSASSPSPSPGSVPCRPHAP
jgi:hypothetical protein